jgi:DNA-binding NtrC family response regulator
MARVVAFIPDLLFGSQVQGALRVAGHEVELVSDAESVRSALTGTDVLVVDLTAEPARRVGLLESLWREDRTSAVRTLAFYSHVDADTRSLAESAGFHQVVPRSRMAREGADLVERLVADRLQ